MSLFTKHSHKLNLQFTFVFLMISSVSFSQVGSLDTLEFKARIKVIDWQPSDALNSYEIETKFLVLVDLADTVPGLNQTRIVLRYICSPDNISLKEDLEYTFKVKVTALKETEKRREFKNHVIEYVLKENSVILYEIVSYK